MIEVDNWEEVTICNVLTGKTEHIVVDSLAITPWPVTFVIFTMG